MQLLSFLGYFSDSEQLDVDDHYLNKYIAMGEYVCVHVYVYVRVCVCTCVCVCRCMCVCMCACACMRSVCVCVRAHGCMCMCSAWIYINEDFLLVAQMIVGWKTVT